MDEKDRFRLDECGLIAYSHGEYYALGKYLGKFGYSVRKINTNTNNSKNNKTVSKKPTKNIKTKK